MKISIQNHAFKKARKMQNMSFSRSEINQNVIFSMQTFFQNLTCRTIFNSKNNALFFFSVQNLTRCKNLVSKSNALEIFNSKPGEFQIFFPKSDFYLVFQILTG